MIAPPTGIRESYCSAFEAYLRDPSEAAMHAAYEVGRDAIGRERSILELATIHHEALLGALEHGSSSAETESVVRAATDFFLEALSAFEMVRRGFREAQEAALVERRHALILRQLSSFLADASLALNASDSLREVLQLVAEQARELTGAECSVARARVEATDTYEIDAISHSEADAGWEAFVTKTDLSALSALVDSQQSSLRLGEAELANHSAFAAATGDARRVRRWLAAALTGWDGGRLGSIQLFDQAGAEFSELDEAVLVHLAQMAVTAVERARRST